MEIEGAIGIQVGEQLVDRLVGDLFGGLAALAEADECAGDLGSRAHESR